MKILIFSIKITKITLLVNYNKDRLYLENEQNKQIDMLLTKFSTVNNNEYINENEMIIFVGKNISKVIGKI